MQPGIHQSHCSLPELDVTRYVALRLVRLFQSARPTPAAFLRNDELRLVRLFQRVLSVECEPVSSIARRTCPYPTRSARHSRRAASRCDLKVWRRFMWRSRLKWLWNDAWIEANFCRFDIRLNLDIARSRRRNGRWLFSALLLRCRPTSWRPIFPISFIAAPYDLSRSVTTVRGAP